MVGTRHKLSFLNVIFLMFIFGSSGPAVSADRVYVGVRACQECHHNKGKRNQFNLWRLSKHARAHAALAMPEAKEIARLSGIDRDPFESPICLGCHTTAYQAETWETDPGFFYEDGIQCEFCHGPGSGYMNQETMANREMAMKAGLRMPDREFCMHCHQEKGSHLAVLDVKAFGHEKAMGEIDHRGRGGALPFSNRNPVTSSTEPQYVGVRICAGCHKGKERGYTFSKWRLSAHADAYAILGTRKAGAIAREKGMTENPQESQHCLRCHSTGFDASPDRFSDTFDRVEGVQCEACHGPGSEHVLAIFENSGKKGILTPSKETCSPCHVSAVHDSSFDYDVRMERLQHFRCAESPDAEMEYKTPTNLVVTKDGEKLFVVCEGSDSLIVVDSKRGKILAEVDLQSLPYDVCLSPDESRAYVTNRGSDSVSVVDTETYGILGQIPVGDEPHGLATDREGRTLYVANAGSYDVSVIDLLAGKEIKRLAAARGAWAVERSPDGEAVFITNNLPHFTEFRKPPFSEVTVIETERSVVERRIFLPEANMVQGVSCSPDGEFVLVTLVRTKNLVPMTRVLQGWAMTNGLGVLWRDGRVDQLLLDEGESFFADPTDVVLAPDGSQAYISSGGTNTVAVIEVRRLMDVLETATEEERRTTLPNHLGVPAEYVLKRISVGRNPRGLAVSGYGKFVYVADTLDDTVSVIDVNKQERTRVIDLGGPKEITLERMGERIFHSAAFTFGQQFSCHSCHPDGGSDGITYDIEPDGLGFNPVDNRTLRGILDTAPFKWEGTNPSLRRQCGPRLAVFFTRIDPFTQKQAEALDRYICTIPRSPNRYRKENVFTPAQRRGRKIFQRTHTNTGEVIPVENRCNYCHPPPYYTNREKLFVGKGSWLDSHEEFDVPHLNNIYETPPYLHDGRAHTLEEIWTRFNPNDEHGVTNDMTKDQLNDLIEYLKTL